MRSHFRRFALLIFALAALSGEIRSQSQDPRIEVGGQLTVLHFRDFKRFDQTSQTTIPLVTNPTDAGGGVRGIYNLTRHLSLDGEVDFFPSSDVDKGGRKTLGLVGLKAGRRFESFGLFAKGRPGVMRVGRVARCPNEFRLEGCGFSAETAFALDAGGVLEFYPSRRTVVRFDAGDLMVFYPNRLLVRLVNEPGGPGALNVFLSNRNSHNLRLGVGFSIRF